MADTSGDRTEHTGLRYAPPQDRAAPLFPVLLSSSVRLCPCMPPKACTRIRRRAAPSSFFCATPLARFPAVAASARHQFGPPSPACCPAALVKNNSFQISATGFRRLPSARSGSSSDRKLSSQVVFKKNYRPCSFVIQINIVLKRPANTGKQRPSASPSRNRREDAHLYK